MKLFIVVLCLVTFLSGCGGGGGSEGSGVSWPAIPIGVNEQISGELVATDIVAPDGSYVDLYQIVLSSTVDLNISLTSAAFDTVLLVFDSSVIGLQDLNSWDTHLIADNDDVTAGSTDSALTLQLGTGTYVIAVNAFDPGTGGAYLLTTSSTALTLSRPFVQFRTFENTADNRFMGWIDIKENGSILAPGTLQTARLYDPLGTELVPVALEFISEWYTVAAWDPVQNVFGSIAIDGNSGYSFNLANHPNLTAGTYTFGVVPAAGALLSMPVESLGKIELPAVAASSMNYQWNLDGSLTLSWIEPPAGTFEQYRVHLADTSGNSIFYGRILPGVNQVTLQASLVAQINSLSQLSAGTTVSWTMHTRNYLGSNNYARGVSDSLTINWP